MSMMVFLNLVEFRATTLSRGDAPSLVRTKTSLRLGLTYSRRIVLKKICFPLSSAGAQR
jgi:hypothetical protein